MPVSELPVIDRQPVFSQTKSIFKTQDTTSRAVERAFRNSLAAGETQADYDVPTYSFTQFDKDRNKQATVRLFPSLKDRVKI